MSLLDIMGIYFQHPPTTASGRVHKSKCRPKKKQLLGGSWLVMLFCYARFCFRYVSTKPKGVHHVETPKYMPHVQEHPETQARVSKSRVGASIYSRSLPDPQPMMSSTLTAGEDMGVESFMSLSLRDLNLYRADRAQSQSAHNARFDRKPCFLSHKKGEQQRQHMIHLPSPKKQQQNKQTKNNDTLASAPQPQTHIKQATQPKAPPLSPFQTKCSTHNKPKAALRHLPQNKAPPAQFCTIPQRYTQSHLVHLIFWACGL